MQNPKVVLPDYENAFILLVRARRALLDSDAIDAKELSIFDVLVQRDLIMSTPTLMIPKHVYKRLYDEVACRCQLVIQRNKKA